MRRVYLVYYDFGVTSRNHAGMAHLVRMLDERVEVIKPVRSLPHHYKGGQYLARIYAVWLAVYFRFVLKKEDKVFFFEYLTRGTAFQVLTAKAMRFFGVRQPIYALIHLSGQHMVELYKSEHYIRKSLRPLDKIFVFGSSLTSYLRSIGFTKEIATTFHYVDTDYYRPASTKKVSERLQVICIGGLKRNFSLLQSIVSKEAGVDFHILMGKNNLRPLFEKVPNAKLYSFLSEDEMLHLMQQCDVSLSVMEDTIGSNVITTSLATGLVLVVSDVGSIRDYCDDSNSFLCQTEEDFVSAIQQLNNDRKLLQQKRMAALRRAGELSDKVFVEQFKTMI